MLRLLNVMLATLTAPTLALTLTLTGTARAAEPVVPFTTEFHHWDNHWFVWLPRHPVYEAVEVMSAAVPGAAKPLVWAFFTERAVPKLQHHYVNSRELASRTGWTYADIDYATSGGGDGDAPLGLVARFSEAADKTATISMDFPPDSRLTHGALTDQVGHSGDLLFLLFYRDRAALTTQSAVTVGGVEVSEPRAGDPPLPFRAAYSRNIFVATIPFRDSRISFGAATAGSFDFREQSRADGRHLYVANRPGGDQVELLADAEGRLERYVDRRGPHALTVDFTTPLATSGKAAYGIGFDDFQDLVTGDVDVTPKDNGFVLNWQFQTPAWTRGHPLRTQLRRDSDGGTVVTVSRSPS